MSDSLGNTWIMVKRESVSFLTHEFWYAWQHAGGTLNLGSDTVTYTNGGNYPIGQFCAWSGTNTYSDPLDPSYPTGVGTFSGGASTLQPGSITPSVANELLITSFANVAGAVTDSINSSFIPMTLQGTGAGGVVDTAYLVTSSAKNPAWTTSAPNKIATIMAAFQPGTSVPPPTITSFTVNGGSTTTVAAGFCPTFALVTTNATNTIRDDMDSQTFTTSNQITSTNTLCPYNHTANTYTYTLTASNSSGSVTSTVTVTVTPAPGPTISAASCVGNSPVSVLCQWTTDMPSDSQVTCTRASTPYASPTVNPIKTGSDVFWGVTSHSMAVTTPVTDTGGGYSCVIKSTSVSGNASTATLPSCSTLAAVSSTPLAVASISPPTRINDQYNGANGLPNNGAWIDGDTEYNTWAADGYTYGMYQDGKGVGGANGVGGLGFVRWDAAHMIPTQLWSIQGGTIGFNPWASEGPLSARGIQYMFLGNGYGSEACCFNVIKSADNWTSSISPQRNTGPATAAVSGIDLPPLVTATISGSSWSSGTLTLTVSAWSLTPPANVMVYITGSTGGNCDGYHTTTATSNTTIAYASSNVSCTAGTVQYQQAMGPLIALPGDSGIYTEGISPVQPCQDYSINCTWVANMDGWVYIYASYRGLLRVRIEDLPLQDYSKYQCYAGLQVGDDGMYDSNWVSVTVGNCKALTAAAGQFDPYAYMAGNASKGYINYIPDFNRFVLSIHFAPSNCPMGSAIFDLGPYPWGQPVLIGSINRDLRFPGLCPGFPNALLSTYQKVSSNPLTATMTWVTSGGPFRGPANAGNSDNYSPYIWRVRLVPKSATAKRSAVSANGGGRLHISNGLQLFYDFQNLTGGLQIPNLSPNDAGGTWSYVAPYSTPPINDRYGLTMFALGGGDNVTDGISWTGMQQSLAMQTPYNPALNSYTAFVCFGHYPYQFNGTTINNGQAGEQVLSKNGGDLSIVRHGATFGAGASWDVTVHGTVVGSVAIPDGTFGCIAVRVSGTAATVYQSSAIARSLPLTPTAGPTVVNASGTAGNLILGGSPSLWGTLSEMLIYNRALSDVELIHEMDVIRREMAVRWITIDSVSLN